jgi:hypothetical protein
MAVAVPKHRSNAQGAPAPARTAPPEPKKRPRDRPKPGGQARSTATPTAPSKGKTKRPRKVRLDDPPAKPGGKRENSARAAAAKAMPTRKGAATKTAPTRRKVAPKRRPAGVIPIAAGHAGRAAVAVTQLPESGLIHRLTRGRAWIGVLGVLLIGIVALNVVTLSFAASSGKIDAKNTELSKENSMLQNRKAQVSGVKRLHQEAVKLGLTTPSDATPQLIEAKGSDVAEATARLAAAAPAAVSGSETGAEESSAGGEESAVAGGESAAGEESSGGEGSTGESTEGSAAESEFTPEELAIYEREYAELVASEGLTETPAG